MDYNALICLSLRGGLLAASVQDFELLVCVLKFGLLMLYTCTIYPLWSLKLFVLLGILRRIFCLYYLH